MKKSDTFHFNWLHFALTAATLALAWNCYQQELTIQSAVKLINTQSSALDTAHRALDSTAEHKLFKATQEASPAIEK